MDAHVRRENVRLAVMQGRPVEGLGETVMYGVESIAPQILQMALEKFAKAG
jgi:hypothetical protein